MERNLAHAQRHYPMNIMTVSIMASIVAGFAGQLRGHSVVEKCRVHMQKRLWIVLAVNF